MCLAGPRSGDKQAIKEAMQILHQHSTRDLDNPLHKAPLGHTGGRGLFSLIWPEVLHQDEAGIMKKSITCNIKAIERTGISKYSKCGVAGPVGWQLPT